jgi:hypothetical protein
VKGLVERAGFARWNKSMIATPRQQNNTGGRSSGDSNAVFVYIPFVKENNNFTNSVLIIKVTNTDTVFNLLYAEEYVNYGFDTTVTNQWNARNVFHLFTRFDNFIFGHTKFRVKDSRLFNMDTSLLSELSFFDDQSEGCSNCSRSIVPETVCNTYKKCQSCAQQRTVTKQCCNPITITICTLVWTDMDGGTGGGGGEKVAEVAVAEAAIRGGKILVWKCG